MNSPKETLKSKIFNIILPFFMCLIVLCLSLYLDIIYNEQQMFWLQRSGSIITILGAWIAFHESRESMKLVDSNLYIETKLPYRYLSLSMIVVGTVLWGYGDILFKLP